MSALVSIIVPCYKQADYLPETLESVLAQTYQNWECIIVNDGSPDNTDEVAESFLEKDLRFKYVQQSNMGLSMARNNGIAHSEGYFILPLDGDDIIEPTYLEKAIDWFIHYPETKLVYCKARFFDYINEDWELEDYTYDNLIWRNCIFCSAVFKRMDYDKTNGYNSNMQYGYEDWDFWLTFLNREDKVHRINEVLFLYRIKEESMTTLLHQHHLSQAYLQIFKNHREIYEPFCDRLFLYDHVKEENNRLNTQIQNLRESHAYRLGKYILRPFSIIRKK